VRAESTRARKAYDDAEHGLKLTKEEKQRAEEEYAELFDVEGYGREGEWKKLEGTCLEKDTGEYVSLLSIVLFLCTFPFA
jgi:protein kinase C substrate 80K-H